MDNFFDNQIGNFAEGRIIDINRQNRFFTIMSCNNPSSRIRFNVPNMWLDKKQARHFNNDAPYISIVFLR